VLQGEVVVTKWINDAEERILKRLGAGDFFGEMAIINNAARAATVSTTTPTTVLEITKDTFDKFLRANSNASIAVVREVSRRLRENDQMAIEDLRFKAKELADAYQQLAEQDFARQEFLTAIAHELRTPLTAANGFTQIMRLGLVQGDTLNEALDTVLRNLQQIITLINDILFLQEMELILPEFQKVDIGTAVASAVEDQRERAKKNRVGLNLLIHPGIPIVICDSKSIGRAVGCLLDNAIKFSPDGGEVIVEVGHKGKQVFIKVIDHGVGIPPEVMPRIFDRFFHLDKIGDHLFRGIGLGLSIARQVIEQHKGEITVESEFGRGSTFIIWLNK
jgi:signal transduction histidine kinase